jgi:hypothetical protein
MLQYTNSYMPPLDGLSALDALAPLDGLDDLSAPIGPSELAQMQLGGAVGILMGALYPLDYVDGDRYASSVLYSFGGMALVYLFHKMRG